MYIIIFTAYKSSTMPVGPFPTLEDANDFLKRMYFRPLREGESQPAGNMWNRNDAEEAVVYPLLSPFPTA